MSGMVDPFAADGGSGARRTGGGSVAADAATAAVVASVLLLYSYECSVFMRVLKWAPPLPIHCGQGFPLLS